MPDNPLRFPGIPMSSDPLADLAAEFRELREQLAKRDEQAAKERDDIAPVWVRERVLVLLTALIVALAGWVWLMEGRVNRIEANRFTAAEAAELERRIFTSLPPKWLTERLDRIDARLTRIEGR